MAWRGELCVLILLTDGWHTEDGVADLCLYVTEQENTIWKATHIVDICHIFNDVENIKKWISDKMADLIYTQQ